ncbi:MAG: dipeptidase [Clostridiales bacterium]|nr:dipeptidase [Clostridiales bacterium]MDY4009279.1 membrane dipeptidase [Candidatus Limiplasma sp.]
MLICDTHADTLYAMAAGDRPAHLPLDVRREHFTDSRHVRVQAMALFVCTGGMQLSPTIVERELAALERLKHEGFVQITQLSQARPGVPNVLLTIEGGEAFGSDPSNVERFARLGVRAAALVWNNQNLLAYPAVGGSGEGLTPFGCEIVRRMRQCRMAVDVSHLNERGFWDVMDGGAPPMASHSCARALCGHPRNLSDSQLRALFAANGYVGVNFYPVFLRPDGRAGIDSVIDHIAYMCDLGGERCVGLGSDFDGIEQYPDGLRTAGDLPALFDRMRQRGFDPALIERIAGQNFARYLQALCP